MTHDNTYGHIDKQINYWNFSQIWYNISAKAEDILKQFVKVKLETETELLCKTFLENISSRQKRFCSGQIPCSALLGFGLYKYIPDVP